MGVAVAGKAKARRQGSVSGRGYSDKVNGHRISDVLDYRFYTADTEVTLEIIRGNDTINLSIRKETYDDIGLEFESYLMDEQRRCKNKCVFCFIDQLPKGMRETLYFKDDDSRLSFLFGNYITLTNITEHEIERIISMRISPVNISVHTTNPSLRCEMMNNRFAGESLAIMQRFADAGILMNCQIVLCPGINDGAELDRTLNDLSGLCPAVQSVAVVPVGLTKHRQGLTPLRPFTADEAVKAVRQVEEFGERMIKTFGARVFYPADEFYLKAGLPVPDEEFYGDFPQLENGVGLMALFKSEFDRTLKGCRKRPKGSRIIVATGAAAAPFISGLVDMARKKYGGLNAEVVPVINRFFGETIDVAGLVTGRDLIEQLKPRAGGGVLLIPSAMLRHDGDLFLDDISPGDVQNALGLKVVVVPVDGSSFLNALMS